MVPLLIVPLVRSREQFDEMVCRERLLAREILQQGIPQVTEDNKRVNIGLELDRSQRNLGRCSGSAPDGSFETAVSMAYYAAFHMAQALLLMEGWKQRLTPAQPT